MKVDAKIITYICFITGFVFLLYSCGGEQFESESYNLIAETPMYKNTLIHVGQGVERYMRMECGYKCVRYIINDLKQRECAEYELDCVTGQPKSIKLYKSQNHNQIFGPHPEGGYYGCGIKAAQNALYYLGVDVSQVEISNWITRYDVPFSNKIAVVPGDLSGGLQKLLNQYGHGTYRVRRHSGKGPQDVIDELKRGFPVIVLANNGDHWLTVTGYKEFFKFFVIDYPPHAGNWVGDLGMFFDGLPEWVDLLPIDIIFTRFKTYKSGSMITIERLPDPTPTPTPTSHPTPPPEPTPPPNGHIP